MKTDYSTLDNAICAAIHSGADNFTRLTSQRSVMDIAAAVAERKNGFAGLGWRVIDRRLQALRKAGKIIYKGGKWTLVVAA